MPCTVAGGQLLRHVVAGPAPGLSPAGVPPRTPLRLHEDMLPTAAGSGGGVSRCLFAVVAAAAVRLAGRGRSRGFGSHLGSSIARRAETDGGVDFAIIRFKVPGFDDLTNLPRVILALGTVALVANRVYFPPTTGEDERIVSELTAAALGACCAILPWAGNRLIEAERRQVSTTAPTERQSGCLQTFALDASLPQVARVELAWASSSLLRLTNADGLAIWLPGAEGEAGRVICTRGLLRQLAGFDRGSSSVLRALGAKWRPGTVAANGFCATGGSVSAFPEGSLPSSTLPGGVESVVSKPLPGGGVLVLWSLKPRAFDRAGDRGWIAQAVAKIGAHLPTPLAAQGAPSVERCYEVSLPLLGEAEVVEGLKSRDPFSRFGEQIRLAPGVLGLVGLGLLAFNRSALLGKTQNLIYGLDPAQNRDDLVCGVFAFTLLLSSGIWLSEIPKEPDIEDVSEWEGVENVVRVGEGVGGAVAEELRWAWGALSACTRICSMTVFWRGACVMQGGTFKRADAGGNAPLPGPLCQDVMERGKGRYLAQLANYPSKVEFFEYLPERTQGLLLTPLRAAPDAPAEGVIAMGVDCVRGVGKIDQAWIGALAEKLSVGLAA